MVRFALFSPHLGLEMVLLDELSRREGVGMPDRRRADPATAPEAALESERDGVKGAAILVRGVEAELELSDLCQRQCDIQ